jgi:hypothetical protein
VRVVRAVKPNITTVPVGVVSITTTTYFVNVVSMTPDLT